MKVNITIDDELMEKIDEFADRNFMTRSGFFALCANQYIQAHDTLPIVKNVFSSLSKIANQYADGEIDKQEAAKQLDSMEAALNASIGK